MRSVNGAVRMPSQCRKRCMSLSAMKRAMNAKVDYGTTKIYRRCTVVPWQSFFSLMHAIITMQSKTKKNGKLH